MILVIIRHGKAEPDSTTGRDADRALNERGKRQSMFLANQLLERFSSPRRLVRVASSDAVRARDTARIVARALAAPIAYDDRLLVDEPVAPVLDLIAERRAESTEPLILVGHNPQLSSLTGVVSAGPTAPAVRLKTGMAAFINLAETTDTHPLGDLAETIRLAD